MSVVFGFHVRLLLGRTDWAIARWAESREQGPGRRMQGGEVSVRVCARVESHSECAVLGSEACLRVSRDGMAWVS
jgi:hypothetical protein